jgi:hypothetical protein
MSREVTRATCVELARRAWDFRDAAIGAEHVLGERDEYQLNAAVPVARLIAASIELALTSYILSVDGSRTHVLSADRQHDLTSLLAEADQLGLMRLFRVDEYDMRMLSVLALCSRAPAHDDAIAAEAVPPFDAMKRLCEKLLEAADVTSGHERIKYDPGS